MGKGEIWAKKWSGARLFRLEEVKFFCTFELFSQSLPLPPTQETNTETGLFQGSERAWRAEGRQTGAGVRQWPLGQQREGRAGSKGRKEGKKGGSRRRKTAQFETRI